MMSRDRRVAAACHPASGMNTGPTTHHDRHDRLLAHVGKNTPLRPLALRNLLGVAPPGEGVGSPNPDSSAVSESFVSLWVLCHLQREQSPSVRPSPGRPTRGRGRRSRGRNRCIFLARAQGDRLSRYPATWGKGNPPDIEKACHPCHVPHEVVTVVRMQCDAHLMWKHCDASYLLFTWCNVFTCQRETLT